MIYRVIQITKPMHLSVKLRQLQLTDKETGEVVQRPVEDLGVLVVEHPQVTWTHMLMQELMEQNVAVVVCDAHYMPSGLLLPLSGNTLQQERFTAQVNAGLPLKKQLWQQTIKAKIQNQAGMLDSLGKESQALRYLARQVRSGDADNHEAQAAQRYWSQLFLHEFRREREGDWPNPALNYGYAILRAATARALVAAGLLPTLGIHHHNRYNAYALADDIMEPYRPYVDSMIIEAMEIGYEGLSKECRQFLLALLHIDVIDEKGKGPLIVALHRSAQSLVNSYLTDECNLSYPAFRP